MKYWKRVDSNSNATTVESYSHDLPIPGAVEITQVEFESTLINLQNAPAVLAAREAEQTKATKRAEANARALAAIEANKGAAPWGAILMDVATAQGWVEPQ